MILALKVSGRCMFPTDSGLSVPVRVSQRNRFINLHDREFTKQASNGCLQKQGLENCKRAVCMEECREYSQRAWCSYRVPHESVQESRTVFIEKLKILHQKPEDGCPNVMLRLESSEGAKVRLPVLSLFIPSKLKAYWLVPLISRVSLPFLVSQSPTYIQNCAERIQQAHLIQADSTIIYHTQLH